ncbi:MAG: hypothetical protein ACFE9O_09255 [Promethearchaeota archaeon]
MFTLQDTSLHAQRIRSKRKLLIVFIGVSIFAFLLVFISVRGFLDQAFMVLYFGQFLPPELGIFFPAFNLAQLHDIGIILASVGLVVMYLPITLTLVISEKTVVTSQRFRSRLVHFLCHSDLFKILGFMGLFLASMGVWFCMHQAYLYQGEYLKGTLLTNSYVFLTFEISPLLLHVAGNFLVIYGLIIIASINAIKVVSGLLSQQGRLS